MAEASGLKADFGGFTACSRSGLEQGVPGPHELTIRGVGRPSEFILARAPADWRRDREQHLAVDLHLEQTATERDVNRSGTLRHRLNEGVAIVRFRRGSLATSVGRGRGPSIMVRYPGVARRWARLTVPLPRAKAPF